MFFRHFFHHCSCKVYRVVGLQFGTFCPCFFSSLLHGDVERSGNSRRHLNLFTVPPDVVIYGSWLNACRQGSKWETALTILAEMSQEYVRLFLGMKLDLRELSKDRETKFPAVFLQEWRNTCLNLLALCNRVRFQTPCSAALEHT